MVPKFWIASFLALAVFGASACGGGDKTVDAEDWVDDLCDATEDLARAERDAYDEYDEVFLGADVDAGEEVRDALYQYVKDYNRGLDRFEDDVDDAGKPDVRDSDKVLEAVADFIADERRAVNRAERAARDLREDGADLAFAVDEVFTGVTFVDLLELLVESDGRDADEIIELIDEDDDCASFLFFE